MMAGKGSRVNQEQSIISRLKEMVKTDAKVYFILWKYAPQLLKNQNIKSFDDLKSNYKVLESKTMTEAFCNNWLLESNVQSAVKYVLNRTNQLKLIELYHTFYNKAKEGDVSAFKAFTEFADKFLKDNKDSELLSIINGVEIDEDDEVEFEMKL